MTDSLMARRGLAVRTWRTSTLLPQKGLWANETPCGRCMVDVLLGEVRLTCSRCSQMLLMWVVVRVEQFMTVAERRLKCRTRVRRGTVNAPP